MRWTLIALILFLLIPASAGAAPGGKVSPRARCAVCGMFVAKYPSWISVIETAGKKRYFDGAKDMLAFHFAPESFGGKSSESKGKIWVKDYYSLKWIDGRKAFYVTGSDVLGPMGHEFIPFSTRKAAETFKADHKGKRILAFADITPEMVEKMRKGMMMKHGGMKGMGGMKMDGM